MEIEGGKISGSQLLALLVLTRLVPVTIEFPLVTGIKSPQDAWISSLVGTVLSILPVLLMVRLSLKYPGKTIIEYSQLLLGKFFGKIAGFVLVWYWLSIAATMLRSVGDAYTTAIMPETPILAFILVVGFLSANAARSGLEVVGRLGEVNMLVVILSVLLTLSLPYKVMNFENLLPVLSKGIRPIMLPTGTAISFFVEFIILGMVAPYLNNPQTLTKSSLGAIAISGFMMTAFTVVLIAVFGPTVSSLMLPAFSLARMISIGEFLERLEVIPMSAWTITVAITLAFFLWASAVATAQLLSLKRFQSLVYPLAAISVAFSILFFESFFDLELYFKKIWVPYSLTVTLGISIILYLASFIRGRSSASTKVTGLCHRNH
ncbi:MAG TPA: endospore germination permease [Firmicutes bacterium]|nr:endospore germination permease [Candidatus Fermentithermobacillaceae bacterium]